MQQPELVDGSKELSDGASTLDEKYQEFDSGIGTLDKWSKQSEQRSSYS